MFRGIITGLWYSTLLFIGGMVVYPFVGLVFVELTKELNILISPPLSQPLHYWRRALILGISGMLSITIPGLLFYIVYSLGKASVFGKGISEFTLSSKELYEDAHPTELNLQDTSPTHVFNVLRDRLENASYFEFVVNLSPNNIGAMHDPRVLRLLRQRGYASRKSAPNSFFVYDRKAYTLLQACIETP